MTSSTLHLIAPAGNCRAFLEALGVPDGGAFLRLVAETMGDGYVVTGNPELLDADEHETHGGRTDDAARAEEINSAFRDRRVRAIVAVRGGAWFTRVLPRIDFSLLDRRDQPVFVLGFSELTTLVNVVAGSSKAHGVLWMGPAFLPYGLRRYAERHPEVLSPGQSAKDWMQARLSPEFQRFCREMVDLVEGRGRMSLRATCVRGRLPAGGTIRLVGGNLTVLSTLIGSRYESAIAPEGRWIVLEDFNDKPERFDRFLAHLTLARYWERCDGVLLGDFHQDTRDLGDAILALLEYHIPPGCDVPVLVTRTVGHIWPMTPLPLNRPLRMRVTGANDCAVECMVENGE